MSDAYSGWAALVLAEGLLFAGEVAGADEVLRGLDRVGDHYLPLLERLHGLVKSGQGDRDGALVDCERSLAAARARGADYEIASTLLVLGLLDANDREADLERQAIEERLGIERLIVPSPAVQPTNPGEQQPATLAV